MSEVDNSIQEILTCEGILAYAFLGQTFASKSDDGTVRNIYKTQLIMDPEAPDVQRIKDATRRVAHAAWPSNPMGVLEKLAAQDKLALHNGNHQEGEEFKGKLFISCNSKETVKPTIVVTLSGAALKAEVDAALLVDPKCPWANTVRANNLTTANVPIGPNHKFFPRSTDRASVVFALYAQSPERKTSKWKERINCQLMGVQFLERGAGFGGGGRVARIDEFGIKPAAADIAIPQQAPANAGAASGLF